MVAVAMKHDLLVCSFSKQIRSQVERGVNNSRIWYASASVQLLFSEYALIVFFTPILSLQIPAIIA